MADIEIWKDIEGYEGLYRISNLGRVMGLDREKVWENIYKDPKGRYNKNTKRYNRL